MAKQTTMGKSSTHGKRTPHREVAEVAPQTKKQIAHGKRQARQQRIIALSLIALGAIVLGIILAAVIKVAWLQPRKSVAEVNGTQIRMDEYVALTNVRRANLENAIANYTNEIDSLDSADETGAFLIQYYQSYIDQLNTDLANVESNSLEELIDDALIREKAGEVGLNVTAAEVEESIAADLDSVFTASTSTVTSTETMTSTTPTPTPSPVPQSTKDDYYKTVLDSMNVTDKEFRAIISRSLLREKVDELLASQVLTTGLVAHIQLIQTDKEEEAIAAEQRVKNGEEFAVVATEVTSDTVTKEEGGDIPAVTPDQLTSSYGEEVSTLAFSLEPGTLGRTASGDRFYVIRLVSKDENGALPEEVISSKKASALTDWLAERKASPDVRIKRLIEPTAATVTP